MNTMEDSPERNPESPREIEDENPSAEEREFLSRLLDTLFMENRPAFDSLLEANPDLVEYFGESERIRRRICAALTGQAGIDLSPEQERLAERVKARLAQRRPAAEPVAPFSTFSDPHSILTSVTRKLPPERAIELYRKITPLLVHQVLSRLDPSANLGVVQQLVDHLCSKDVQQRLRACEHVRDGILHELRSVLIRRRPGVDLSRDDLQRILEECGAMDDLIAMENCIKLAATKAG